MEDQPPAGRRDRLFPHFVARVAGLPYSEIETLRAENTLEAWQRSKQLAATARSLESPLVEALFHDIGTLPSTPADSRTVRQALVGLKRDIHNGRHLSPQTFENVSRFLTPRRLREVQEWNDLLLGSRAALAEGLELYEKEAIRLRRRFQAALRDEGFRRGLLLSSRSLEGQLDRYLRTDPARPGSKERQIERGLMRFFSRMVTKATPFGMFCGIVPGRLETRAGTRPAFTDDPRRRIPHPALDRGLCQPFAERLLRIDSIRRLLPVELNPTLTEILDGPDPETGEPHRRWLFVQTRGQRDRIRHLEPAAPVRQLLEILEDGSSPSLDQLLETLAKALEVEPGEARAFVDRLLELGVLRLRDGLSGRDGGWVRHWLRSLEPIDDPDVEPLRQLLEDLDESRHQYATASSSRSRRQAFERARRLAGSISGPEGEPGVHPNPIYEDSRASGELPLALADFAEDLGQWVDLTSPIAWIRGQQGQMRQFFDRFYGAEKEPVSALRFFRDFVQHGKRIYREAIRSDPESDLPGLLRAADQRLLARIRKRWREAPDQVEITLQPEDLTLEDLELPATPEAYRSVSFFAEHLPSRSADAPDRLLIQEYLLGFGKYFSRFLPLLPSAVARDLGCSIEALGRDRMAEICADIGSNTDVHPRFLPWELSHPSDSGTDPSRSLEPTDLFLDPHPEIPHRLRLRLRGEDREVMPIDLGFQNPHLRPPLVRFFALLNPGAAYSLPLPESPEEPPSQPMSRPVAQPPPHPARRPRISFRRLVLARQRWTLPADCLPTPPKTAAEEADYFFRVQQWREELGLPEVAFLKVQLSPDAEPPGPGIREQLHKPQFIDFGNPVLVQLFARAASNLRQFHLVLEECLPSREHAPTYGQEAYATSLILQLDRAEDPRGGEPPSNGDEGRT